MTPEKNIHIPGFESLIITMAPGYIVYIGKLADQEGVHIVKIEQKLLPNFYVWEIFWSDEIVKGSKINQQFTGDFFYLPQLYDTLKRHLGTYYQSVLINPFFVTVPTNDIIVYLVQC